MHPCTYENCYRSCNSKHSAAAAATLRCLLCRLYFGTAEEIRQTQHSGIPLSGRETPWPYCMQWNSSACVILPFSQVYRRGFGLVRWSFSTNCYGSDAVCRKNNLNVLFSSSGRSFSSSGKSGQHGSAAEACGQTCVRDRHATACRFHQCMN